MWISTKESLPNEDEWVLVSAMEFSGDNFDRPFVAHLSDRKWYTIEGTPLYDVSHWMPVPELPE